MTEDNRTINPEARNITIGAKRPRQITIYPLSIADQMKLTDRFSEVIQEFGQTNRDEMTNEMAIQQLKRLIQDNLPEIMSYVVDEEEDTAPTLDEITNKNLYEIAKTIFEVNYEDLIKNFKDLFGRVSEMVSSQEEVEE